MQADPREGPRAARLSSERDGRLDRRLSLAALLEEPVAQVQPEICDSLFGLILHNSNRIFQLRRLQHLRAPPARSLKAELRHFLCVCVCVNCDVAN